MATVRCIGLSRDYRTQRWNVTCDCGKGFEPETTMLSTQFVTCPRCKTEYFCDYNAEPKATIKPVVYE